MERLIQDLRYGARNLRKGGGVTLAAIFALALGIGGSVAIFTVVNSVVLRPLPYRDAHELVVVLGNFPEQELLEIPTSPGEYDAYLAKKRALESIGAFTPADLNLTGLDRPLRTSVSFVTASLFGTLGVAPAIGRQFETEEEADGRANVVILNDRLWRSAFAADPDVLGRTIHLDQVPYTVVGVMPRGFDFPKDTDLWAPLGLTPAQRAQMSSRFLFTVGRLADGIDIDAARADMTRIQHEINDEQTDGHSSDWRITVRALDDFMLGKGTQTSMMMLLAAVAFVLLIACANVANLLLARGVSRERDLAIAAALGASSRLIVRQLLTESVLLSMIGGGVGLLLAWWGVDALIALAPDTLPRSNEIGMDLRVLAVALALSVGTGLLFGLAPALKANRIDVQQALNEGSRSTSGGRALARKWLVGVQIGMAMVLLLGAGLMIRSFFELTSVDPGFEPEGVLTAGIKLPEQRYGEVAQSSAFFSRLEERLGAIPGVKAVGVTTMLPLDGRTDWTPEIEGYQRAPGEPYPTAEFRRILPGFQTALGIRLVSGRFFDARDRDPEAPVALINESMSKRYFKGEALGRRLRTCCEKYPWATIVGVVADSHDWGLDEKERPTYFYSLYTRPERQLSIVLSTAGDPSQLIAPLRSELAAIDSDLPLYDVRTMNQIVDESLGQRRFSTLLLILFAAVAALLAAIGIYGLMFHHAQQRRHEVGIRMALGSSPRQVMWLVMSQALQLVGWGLAGGLIAGIALSRTVESLLYGVEGFDPLTLLAVAAILGAVAVLAALVPAVTASRVEPMIALRSE